MKRQTDDEWLEAARARFAREGAEFDIDPDLSPHEGPSADLFVRGQCPACEGRPELERMPYSAMPSPVPAQVCGRCLGIWSPPGSVSSGVTIKAEMHAAYRVTRAPANCAECFGAIMPDGACARCKKRAPALPCPVCDGSMQRTQFGRDWLDYCAACKGTWYGTGELPAIFGVTEDVNRLVIAMHAQTAENLALNGMVAGTAAAATEPGLLGKVFGSFLRR
jgi:hypothetical protein